MHQTRMLSYGKTEEMIGNWFEKRPPDPVESARVPDTQPQVSKNQFARALGSLGFELTEDEVPPTFSLVQARPWAGAHGRT